MEALRLPVLVGALALLTVGCAERRNSFAEAGNAGRPAVRAAAPGGETHLTVERFRTLPEFHGRLVALDVLEQTGRPPPPGGGSYLRLTFATDRGAVLVVEDFTTFRADFVTVVADLLAADRVYPRDLFVPRTIE